MTHPILIDSDMLLFESVTAAEVDIEWQPDIVVRQADLLRARESYWSRVDYWCEKFNSTREDCWHCFTDNSGFRKRLSSEYKFNRWKLRKPVGYGILRNEIMQETQATLYEAIEADDVLSILADIYSEGKDEPVIVSNDKDLMQVPGLHAWHSGRSKEIKAYPDDPYGILHSVKNPPELVVEPVVYEVSKAAAERYALAQAVIGDATDGVSGCPGIGEVKGLKFANSLDLSNPLDCWEKTVRLYEKTTSQPMWFNSVEEALLQTRLTRVLKASQYNFDTHEVTLWTPPTSN